MLDGVVYRLKQLFFALFARMRDEDKVFARQNLNIKEAALFFGLPEFEQKHGVVVAQRMMGEAKGRHDLSERKVIRLGLLHDIGKSAVRLSVFDKSALVILHRILPFIYNYFARLGEKEQSFAFFRKFYVHKHHGLIGSILLKRIGESHDILSEVASHDKPQTSHDKYMLLLDQADSTY